jgi:transcriptional regulator with XRE-family HTH domain
MKWPINWPRPPPSAAWPLPPLRVTSGDLPRKQGRLRQPSWKEGPLQFWNGWLNIKISKRYRDVPRDLQQLGNLIKREREGAGWTVRQLAEAAGLVPSTVSRLETGFIAKPQPDHLQKLALALGIDVEELYAEAGYLTPGTLPELRPYLRAKYGLTDELANRVEGYLQAVRDTNQRPGKEGRHDTGDKAA